MRRPWQRRPASPARHALPRQSARWAEPALPPVQGGLAVPAPPITAPAPVPTPAPAAAPAAAGVLLGFADGSHVQLDASSPTAVALRAVADVLAQRDGR